MPASISRIPAGDRRIAAFPADPLAKDRKFEGRWPSYDRGGTYISGRHYGEIRVRSVSCPPQFDISLRDTPTGPMSPNTSEACQPLGPRRAIVVWLTR
jgi:hypothetical protein